MRESVIENHLIACVKKAGGELRKVKWLGVNGAPDRLVLLEGFACFVELKAPGERPKLSQLREHRTLRWAAIPVTVIDTLAGVERLIFERRFD